MNDNAAVFRALLAKDWRLVRAPVVALLIVGVGCYLVPLSAWWTSNLQGWRLDRLILDCATGGIFLTAFFGSAFGGMAIAGERSDHTAEFVGVLPVSRLQVILSKWLVSFLVLGGSALIHFAVWAITLRYGHHSSPDSVFSDAGDLFSFWIGPLVSFYGVAWMLSTLTRHVAISTCGAIGVTIATLFWKQLIHNWHQGFDEWLSEAAVITLLFGIAGLAIGTNTYLRRIEP